MSDKELIKQLEEVIVDKHEEIERLKISLSAQEELTMNEHHKKKQLENIIKEVREYIEEKYDYILKDDTFLDHDERIDKKQIQHILETLNYEVEIIEDNKIEKITLLGEEIKSGSLSNWLDGTTINEEKIASCIECNAIKINEIIDKLNKENI